jgi:hypothetical protein
MVRPAFGFGWHVIKGLKKHQSSLLTFSLLVAGRSRFLLRHMKLVGP